MSICLAIVPVSALAAATDLCPVVRVAQPFSDERPGQVRAKADRVVSSGPDSLLLTGNVNIEQSLRRLTAQKVDYTSDSGTLIATGNVHYITPDIALRSDSITANADNEILQTGTANYNIRLPQATSASTQPKYGSGSAAKIERTPDGVVMLDDVDYSTCPPGQDGWQLSANTLELNPNRSEGTATHATLWFKDIPIFYTPWLHFPIGSQRKSGFLAPRISNSNSRSIELSTPWYWNIAPQADATLTPRAMSKRGLQLQSQWRYLDTTSHWILDSEYLENDKLTNTNRSFSRLRYRGTPSANWTASIDTSRVSDNTYFSDFGDSFNLSNLAYLERNASLHHRSASKGLNQMLHVRLQDFQPLDNSTGSYQRLPQITYNAATMMFTNGLSLNLHSEWARFERRDSVTGERLHLQPQLQLLLEGDYGFLQPSLSTWHTHYVLGDTHAGSPDRITREVPVFSLDSGLFLERPLGGDRGGVQTLEPRLFYLRVPFRHQSDIPIFESNEYEFSFPQLFRENRFSGTDRIGDAHQLSVALTTRFREHSGREWLRASVGQIHHFEDRRVSLPDSGTDSTSRSDLVLELSGALDANWHTSASWRRDTERESTDRGAVHLGYNGDSGNYINVTHHYRFNDHEQIGLSFGIALNGRWHTNGRWRYALDDKRNIDSLLGLKYENCCWAFHTGIRRYLLDSNNDGTNDKNESTLYFELVMKGLGSFGNDMGTRSEHGILSRRADIANTLHR